MVENPWTWLKIWIQMLVPIAIWLIWLTEHFIWSFGYTRSGCLSPACTHSFVFLPSFLSLISFLIDFLLLNTKIVNQLSTWKLKPSDIINNVKLKFKIFAMTLSCQSAKWRKLAFSQTHCQDPFPFPNGKPTILPAGFGQSFVLLASA